MVLYYSNDIFMFAFNWNFLSQRGIRCWKDRKHQKSHPVPGSRCIVSQRKEGPQHSSEFHFSRPFAQSFILTFLFNFTSNIGVERGIYRHILGNCPTSVGGSTVQDRIMRLKTSTFRINYTFSIVYSSRLLIGFKKTLYN